MAIVIALLALVVAVLYIVIGLFIVPRLARLADEPGGVVRAAQWSAAAFFLGCGATHIGIALHSLAGNTWETSHLVVHVLPHIAQVVGGATFIGLAHRKLEVRFADKKAEAERKRAEREREHHSALLAQRAAEQAAVAELGQRALEDGGLDQLLDDACRLVADTLVTEYSGVLAIEADNEPLRMVAGVGWRDGEVGNAKVPLGPRSQAGFTLGSYEPVVLADASTERRFSIAPILQEHSVRSGMTVLVHGRSGPLGVLGAFTRAQRGFTNDNINFLKSVANVLAGAIDRTRGEEETRRRALHDPLTGLPNRTLFLDRLDHALARRQRGGPEVAVLLVDVDQFKVLNDSYGHQAGDELLVALAPRLRDAIRDCDTVGRLGGDEFVVLAEDVCDESEAAAVAERLARAWHAPFELECGEIFVTASIGIALSLRGSGEPQALLREADAAMYRAKESGRGGHELFDERMRSRALQRLLTGTHLRRAMERGELRLVYQPIVDISRSRIMGVEALLRWQHPERGNVPPDEFIPLAEESGLIVPLGRWVLEEATRKVGEWQRTRPGCERLEVTVNLSGRQIADPGLGCAVASAVESSGLAEGTLGLEITESVLMEGGENPLDALARLKALGARLLIDDFGTGYSSLSYLKRFPLDVLKIDRSFVDGLGEEEEDSAIVAAVVSLARSLGLSVVAEGVETERQLESLRRLGCVRAQGYHLSRPLAPDQLERLLEEGAAEPWVPGAV